MGCDGGTIPRRDELVRLKKKPEQKDKESELSYRWRHCALTQEKLREPVVMCGLGRLYSKQNVIEHLLEKDKMPGTAAHIRSLKDIKTLSLTPNPAYKDCDKTEGGLDVRNAPYICKLIGLEMTGRFRFVALWSCGCVFSERALKEIKTQSCSLCQTPYTEQDVIILNGTEEEMDLMLTKMDARNARLKAEKKDKKAKKSKSEASSTSSNTSASATVTSTIVKPTEIPSTSNATVKSLENPSKLASVLKHTKPTSVKREASDVLADPEIKKLKNGVSVAGDPKATDVYKSLFTSHKSEKEQNRAHWVTYNPFYN